MRSHSVTCQPAEVTFPPLPQPKLVLDLATPEGCRELACLYFGADILSLDLHCILLFYQSGTELFLMPSWFFGSGSGGNGTK